MTIWLPDLAPRPGPRYRALAEAIADAVDGGDLPAGARLPPQRDLAHRLGVTVGTVGRAYALSEQRGLLAAEVGRGTFVRAGVARLRPVARPTAASALDPAPAEIDAELMTTCHWAARQAAQDGDLVNLTVNQPAEVGASDALAAALGRLAGRPDALAALGGYPPVYGLPAHREAAAACFGKLGVAADPARVVLSSGAHQGITLALTALCAPGDAVVTEHLSYGAFRAIAHVLRLRPEGAALDHEGLTPEGLDAACRRTGARVLFVQPTLHNPTSATMGASRREAIAEVAERHDLTVVEDDVYGWLPRTRPAPIQTLIPERTVLLGSASKSLTPALRVGFLLAPGRLRERLVAVGHDLSLGVPSLNAELFRLWVEDGTADRLASAQRAEAAWRMRLAAEILAPHASAARHEGLHLWLPLPEPWRADEFVAAARLRGVAVLPGDLFAVGRGVTPHAVRVSLTSVAERGRLRRGLEVLAELLADRPPVVGRVV